GRSGATTLMPSPIPPRSVTCAPVTGCPARSTRRTMYSVSALAPGRVGVLVSSTPIPSISVLRVAACESSPAESSSPTVTSIGAPRRLGPLSNTPASERCARETSNSTEPFQERILSRYTRELELSVDRDRRGRHDQVL